MNVVLTVLLFVFGLIIGSFLNAVIYRMHSGISLWGYSLCPHCRHRLTWPDLVPLLSFAVLFGKCRYCAKKISWQYPAVELATAVVFGLAGSNLSAILTGGSSGLAGLELFFLLWFSSLLIIIFVFDLIYYLIPDFVVLIGIISVAIYRLIHSGFSLLEGLVGAAIVGGFFGALYLFSKKKWLGFGDVELGFFIGFLLGPLPSVLMLFLAYLSGATVGIVLILTKQRTIKGVLPFGTFLAAATIVMLLFGDQIMSWCAEYFYF